jgi:hypothetical protein
MSNESQNDQLYDNEQAQEKQAQTQTAPAFEQQTADDFADASAQDTGQKAAKQPSIKVDERKATAGAAGARNIKIQWLDVWVGNAKPCKFVINTAPGNGLEATVTQLSYRKTYAGAGTINTQVIPVAPVGTRIKIAVTDNTTGESVEELGHWYDMGRSFSLWDAIKRAIWPGNSGS